ncbi:AfsR/SARP family transcriptional regulator [Dactylosporangium cerinum]
MLVRVLGTAGVQDPAPRLERKARELLSILTVRAPAAVTLDELARLLWDDPPPSTVKTLRAHLSRIRAALQAADLSADVVRVGRDGYRLAVASSQTDVGAVAEARARARLLLADGRPDGAAAVLAAARALWLGEPELPDTVTAAALRQGWRQERRLLVQEHLGCLAAGSDPGSALGELEQLTALDPLDEPLWVHYIRALHRADRQTEALRAAAAARAALVAVGLDPSPALHAAQAGVLRSSVPPPAAPPPSTAVAVRYATGEDGSTAFTRLSDRGRDLVVLNPAMLTIDGLLDGTHARAALATLAEHTAVVCFDRRGIGLSDPSTSTGRRWTSGSPTCAGSSTPSRSTGPTCSPTSTPASSRSSSPPATPSACARWCSRSASPGTPAAPTIRSAWTPAPPRPSSATPSRRPTRRRAWTPSCRPPRAWPPTTTSASGGTASAGAPPAPPSPPRSGPWPPAPTCGTACPT